MSARCVSSLAFCPDTSVAFNQWHKNKDVEAFSFLNDIHSQQQKRRRWRRPPAAGDASRRVFFYELPGRIAICSASTPFVFPPLPAPARFASVLLPVSAARPNISRVLFTSVQSQQWLLPLAFVWVAANVSIFKMAARRISLALSMATCSWCVQADGGYLTLKVSKPLPSLPEAPTRRGIKDP